MRMLATILVWLTFAPFAFAATQTTNVQLYKPTPGGGFIAVGRRNLGSSGMAAYSADGITWSPITGASAFGRLSVLVAL